MTHTTTNLPVWAAPLLAFFVFTLAARPGLSADGPQTAPSTQPTKEAAARAEGFKNTELGATAGGAPLYRACGYEEIERMEVPTPSGVTVPITRMGKKL